MDFKSSAVGSLTSGVRNWTTRDECDYLVRLSQGGVRGRPEEAMQALRNYRDLLAAGKRYFGPGVNSGEVLACADALLNGGSQRWIAQ